MNGTGSRGMGLRFLLQMALAITPFAPHNASAYDQATAAPLNSQLPGGHAGLSYSIPDITLADQDGKRVSLSDQLYTDRPVILNFVFTTCTTVCPISTAIFSKLQAKLSSQGAKFRLISISIDPEHDKPANLKKYAQEFGAGADWRFLSGDTAGILAVQKAFNAYRGSKTNHAVLTFIRSPQDGRWIRFEGLVSADALVHHTLSVTSERLVAK
ncbi:SCO family protein [Methylocaldum sp.]|uniref:SCO family protein n=1 Tax=Methylocaldum sp. TaxID=1969727 RepID=UPI002D70EE58|nr:SCO family protein [Methylocaldum sp.]HYE35910.1 SCO family protein [Methylocaldum sp.]